MMKRIDWNQLTLEDQKQALKRPQIAPSDEIRKTVEDIFKRVQHEGDAALVELTKKFDSVDIRSIRVPESALTQAGNQLDDASKQAIDSAMKSIERFHAAQSQPDIEVDTNVGVKCSLLRRPIDQVGLYIPGGTAPLVSSVLMMAIPASIVGCERVVLCTPPPVNQAILYAAIKCGVDEVYQVGGAQAIAAMSIGTESIRPVAKIFGPGNSYVTEAKRKVMSDPVAVEVDMVAGPTELMVIADNTARADFVAADLLSQAEHGIDSQVVLVTHSTQLADEVEGALLQQIRRLPRREIARASLESSTTVICDSSSTAAEIANLYAPEHLIINTKDSETLVDAIRNAGSIFLGQWTPEAVGDYASGTNHVLPTHGSAISASGLTVADFQKTITVQRLSPEGLSSIGPVVEKLAQMEELEGHREAVSIRLRSLQSELHSVAQ